MRVARFLRGGSKGQSMVLGAVALLCLSLGVLATLNLGQAVHERIKLQNNADAAAYSLATLEARTYNYIAFTNRVQITHYHTAMVMQSYVSFAGYSLAVFGTFADMVQGLYKSDQHWCRVVPDPRNPFCLGEKILEPLYRLTDEFAKLATQAYEMLHREGKTFVEAMSLFNRDAIYRIQLIKALQLNAHILTGMQDFVKRNDSQLAWTDPNNLLRMGINAGVNYYEFWSAFDKNAGLNPAAFAAVTGYSKDLREYKFDATIKEVKDAQAIMAEIANATRSDPNVYDRSRLGNPSMPPFLLGRRKMGQTRLIGKSDDKPQPAIQGIRQQEHYEGCTGDRLASDDYITNVNAVAVLPGAVVPPFRMQQLGDGIRTDAKGGEHYKYKGYEDGYRGPDGFRVVPPPPEPGPKKTFETESDEHKWSGEGSGSGPYLAPYFKFKISGKKTKEYNQPSTWMYLNKQPKTFQTGSNAKPWHMNFTVSGPTRGNFVRTGGQSNNNLAFQAKGGQSNSLDTTIGGERQALMSVMQGINVLSRGQVYYHRPNDWSEQPNFFNPFWRARLAPIAQKLTDLWEEKFGSALMPGPDAGVVQAALQNLLNNALADVFFGVVTQLIAH